MITGATDRLRPRWWLYDYRCEREAASEGRDAVLDLAHVPLALSSLFGNIEALAGRMLAGHRKLVVVSPPDCFASQILRLLRYPYAVTQTLEGAIAALSTRGLGSREG